MLWSVVPFWQPVEEGTDGGWEPSEEELALSRALLGRGGLNPASGDGGERKG